MIVAYVGEVHRSSPPRCSEPASTLHSEYVIYELRVEGAVVVVVYGAGEVHRSSPPRCSEPASTLHLCNLRAESGGCCGGCCLWGRRSSSLFPALVFRNRPAPSTHVICQIRVEGAVVVVAYVGGEGKVKPRSSKKIGKTGSSTRAHVSGWNWSNNIYIDGKRARKIRKKGEKVNTLSPRSAFCLVAKSEAVKELLGSILG